MKILDKYLLREYLYTFAGALFICVIVLLVYMSVENYEDILKNEPGLKYTALFFINSLPFQIIQIIPLAVTVSILFTIGALARHNELIAMVSAGISTKRIAVPILAATFAISLLTLTFNEFVVPGCQERAQYIEKAFIQGKGQKILSRSREIFVKGQGQRFYVMDSFDSGEKVMLNPRVIDLNENGASQMMRLDADRGEFIEGKGEGKFWRFENARRWTYNTSGRLLKYEHFSEPITLAMEEDLDKFLSVRKKPEEMNYKELSRYVAILVNRGESVGYYQTDLHLKIAFPFASFIIALLSYCFAVRLESRNLILGYTLGVLGTILYYGLTALSQAMGHHVIFPSFIAAWASNLVFIAVGVIYLHRLTL